MFECHDAIDFVNTTLQRVIMSDTEKPTDISQVCADCTDLTSYFAYGWQ